MLVCVLLQRNYHIIMSRWWAGSPSFVHRFISYLHEERKNYFFLFLNIWVKWVSAIVTRMEVWTSTTTKQFKSYLSPVALIALHSSRFLRQVHGRRYVGMTAPDIILVGRGRSSQRWHSSVRSSPTAPLYDSHLQVDLFRSLNSSTPSCERSHD